MRTRTGVVAVATASVASCIQSHRDCTGYAPGVQIFDLMGEPRLTNTLPLPELPLVPSDPDHVNVDWRMYDPIDQTARLALPLDENRLAFVAQVYLTCETPAECDTLGLVGVPVDAANVPTSAPVPTVLGTGQRQYFYVLDLVAPGGPAWQSWGASTLEAGPARAYGEPRFAAPIATDGVLAATRLERRTASGDDVNQGEARFMLDRFERQPSGEPIALPPVNVRGYPLARLGESAGVERWISVEAAPGETGHARLLRMAIGGDGARMERELDLDGGRFARVRVLDLETRPATGPEARQRLGLALTTPDNACGSTRLSAICLGTNAGDAAEPLEIASTLELPAGRWVLAATDGEYALLSHDFAYLLVHVDAAGALSVTGARSRDLALYSTDLRGTTLFQAGPLGSRIEFAASP